MREEEEFTEVTLVRKDQGGCGAHKIILAPTNLLPCRGEEEGGGPGLGEEKAKGSMCDVKNNVVTEEVKTEEEKYKENTEDVEGKVETFNSDEPSVKSAREVCTEPHLAASKHWTQSAPLERVDPLYTFIP